VILDYTVLPLLVTSILKHMKIAKLLGVCVQKTFTLQSYDTAMALLENSLNVNEP